MESILRTFQYFLPNSLSGYTWSIVQSWIDDCLTNHTECLNNVNSNLPARLLNVAGNCVYLEETRGLSGKYCALSYCWGDNEPFVTTLQNLDQNKKAINIQQLPQTVQDAIKTTRKLGLKYLWVDALCIIQDSSEDWHAEAGGMRQIYKYAFITISALDATDSNQGFVSPRPINTAKARKTREARLDTGNIRWVFEKAPLLNRAWALQERLLSTRTIHFGREQIFWECCTLTTSERSSHQYLRGGRREWFGQEFKNSLLDLVPTSMQDSRSVQKNISIWEELVKRYTRCKITRKTDALPAISGIASEFAQITGYTYLAGIWTEELRSLLWRRKSSFVQEKDLPRESVDFYVAPSWSWAALCDEVLYLAPSSVVNQAYDARLIGHGLRPHEGNAFGQLEPDSFILLRGAVIAVKLRLDQKVQNAENSVEHAGKIMGNCAFDDIAERVDGRTYWFLRISKIKVGRGITDGVLNVLVLVESENGSGKFRRVGTGSVHKDSAELMEESAVQDMKLI